MRISKTILGSQSLVRSGKIDILEMVAVGIFNIVDTVDLTVFAVLTLLTLLTLLTQLTLDNVDTVDIAMLVHLKSSIVSDNDALELL